MNKLNPFFISDHHAAHGKPFIYETRGFSSIEEHDEEMVRRFNETVPMNGLTYYLGDFCFDKHRIEEFLFRLNGSFWFILGNHDKDLKALLTRAEDRLQGKVLGFTEGFLDLYLPGKVPVTLCHYAMHSWNKSHFNACHLYGHHHRKTDFGGKTLNVTVDNLDGYPIGAEKLLSYMEKRPNNWDYISNTSPFA